MPRRCSVCNRSTVEALHAENRPGRSFRELAESLAVSRSALYRHIRSKHNEPRRLLSAKPPSTQARCAICRMGPEIREFVFQARRAERSVRALAVAVGVSRSAMRWHLRDCVPAAYGLTRSDRSGPQTYSPQAVIDALARLKKCTE